MKLSNTIVTLMLAGSCFAATLSPASAQQTWDGHHQGRPSPSATPTIYPQNHSGNSNYNSGYHGSPNYNNGNAGYHGNSGYYPHNSSYWNNHPHDYRHGYDHHAWQREHDREWREWEARHHRHLTWREYSGTWVPGYYNPGGVWINVNL